MTDRYDPHRAHPDTVLRLLERVLAEPGVPFGDLCAALRNQCRLVRTQAEVDAELAHEVRYYYRMQPPGIGPQPTALIAHLNRLCAEPVTDSGPPGAAAKESREDIAAPGGATTESDPVAPDPGERPCGCEETEELEKQLAALRARNFELAMVLSRVRKLINELWTPVI